MSLPDTYKPAVGKKWLFITAALVWSGVGFYLDFLAVQWLRVVNLRSSFLFISAGLVLAAAIYFIMFKPFADQNIIRIREMNGDRLCFFAFQRWTSYPLVVVMISLGVFLRVYSPIPKPYLAILYLGIGSSLFYASLRYYRYLIGSSLPDQSNDP